VSLIQRYRRVAQINNFGADPVLFQIAFFPPPAHRLIVSVSAVAITCDSSGQSDPAIIVSSNLGLSRYSSRARYRSRPETWALTLELRLQGICLLMEI